MSKMGCIGMDLSVFLGFVVFAEFLAFMWLLEVADKRITCHPYGVV
jgi:hypothetical protein